MKKLKNKLYFDSIFTARGITKRWLRNMFIIVFLVVILLEISLMIIVENYFYEGIRQGILERSQVTASYFGTFEDGSRDFLSAAQMFVDEYEYKDKLELQVINTTGQIVVTSSSHFSPSQGQIMPDYISALSSENGIGSWKGENINGEYVMCISKMLPSADGGNAGAVRFLVSLESANRQIFILSAGIMLLGTFILFSMLVASSYFINTIINPVREIGNIARQIAEGDFAVRIEKQYDDEIGDLSDIVNRMADDLAHTEKVKNDFISSVSHELRTPLTAIKGWSETIMLGDTSDKKTIQTGMKFIIKESERLSSLVEDLLDFSRIQSGRFSITLEKMDILAELAEAVYLFEPRAKKENKIFIYNEPENLPTILGDMNRLRQVFVNIIDNAVKYTDKGDSITVSAAPGSGEIYVIVEDTGCGISQEDLQSITKKFYKANQTRWGFGIGLAVADEIISMHSGKLLIESQEGVGTRVTIALPVVLKQNTNERSIT